MPLGVGDGPRYYPTSLSLGRVGCRLFRWDMLRPHDMTPTLGAVVCSRGKVLAAVGAEIVVFHPVAPCRAPRRYLRELILSDSAGLRHPVEVRRVVPSLRRWGG